MKFQVTGTVSFDFDIEISAPDGDTATQLVEEMEYSSLIEAASPRIKIEDCMELRPRKAKK